jgi:hypothetical protein
MLAKRLAQRGVALSAGALAAVLSQNVASACVPTAVVSATIKAASLFAAGPAAATGLISVKVAALTEGVLKAMLVSKLKTATVVLLVLCLVGGGLGLLARQAFAQKPTGTKQEGTPTAKAENDKDKKDTDKDKKGAAKPEKQPDVSGVIAAVSDDFQTLTLDLPPQIKGDPPTSGEIKLTDKTKLTYFGVGSNGETPTVGYSALVWLVKGSEDTAAGVRLGLKK